MQFTLNGRRVTLTADQVRARVRGEPEPVRQHGVRIYDVVYPVKQAFELAIGVPRSEFTSHIARRQLAALGFEIVGAIEPRVGSVRPATSTLAATASVSGDLVAAAVGEEWHTEARVQAMVVRFLWTRRGTSCRSRTRPLASMAWTSWLAVAVRIWRSR